MTFICPPPPSYGVCHQIFWILESYACCYIVLPFSLLACMQFLNTFSKMSFIFPPPTEIKVTRDAVRTDNDHHCTNVKILSARKLSGLGWENYDLCHT